jgi:hypothetical protein
MADEQREVTITIRGKNLTAAEFDKARKDLAGVDDAAKKTSVGLGSLGTAFKAIGAAVSIGAITSAITSYADLTGELTDLSAKTGIGVEALQRLKYAAEQNGGSLDQVTGAISKLGANLAGGNKSAVGALDALGLSFDQIRSMAPDKAFTTIADSIAKIPDPMAQSKLAMDLFGKSGADLLPMMKGNLSETAAAADRLGIVLSEEAVAAGDEFGDTMGTLAAVGKAVIAQVLEPMIPVLTTVAQWLGDKLPGAVRFVVDALTIGLGRAFLDAKIWFNEFLLGIAEGINRIPLLGEKIGFSSETIAGLRENVDNAKDGLALFTQQSITTSAKQETQARTISTLSLNYGENERATRGAKAANEELDPTIARLTQSLTKQIAAYDAITHSLGKVAATPDLFRLQTVALVEGQPIMTRTIQQTAEATAAAEKWAFENRATLAPSIRAVGTELKDTGTQSVGVFASAMAGLPNVIMSAIQGGGSVIGAAGAHIGTSMMTEFSKRFGPAIKSALPFGIGEAVTALLPTLGALFGPVAEKIGGFFRSIFGGPSADELRGRQAVADFEAQLHSTLNATQKLEAGNVSWKMTVIALRDAFIAQGKSEAEALAAAEALWKSSQSGAAASEAAIAKIKAVLDGAKGAASGLDTALDDATVDRTVRIGFVVDAPPDLNVPMGGSSGGGATSGGGSSSSARTYDANGDGRDENGYAKGGLVTSPERAWIGEGGEPELVGPIDFMTDALAGALRQVGRAGMAAGLAGVMAGGAGNVTVNVLVDKAGNARVLSDEEFVIAAAQKGLTQLRISVPQRAVAGARR